MLKKQIWYLPGIPVGAVGGAVQGTGSKVCSPLSWPPQGSAGRIWKHVRMLGGQRGWEGRPCAGHHHHWTGYQTNSLPRAQPPFPTPTQGEGKQLPPEPMLVKFSAQHRTNISGEPEGIWHQNQVEKSEIAGVTEPGFDGDDLGWLLYALGSHAGSQCWRSHCGPQRVSWR